MSSKLDYLQQKKLNPADELRELLGSLEERQVKIKQLTSSQALLMLRDLDLVFALFEQLRTVDLDLLPEEGRFKAVLARVRQSARPLLKALGGAAALAEHRPAPVPARERWWWYIHEDVLAQQQRLLRQVMIGLVLVLALIGGLVLAFNTILAPSPGTVARLEAENAAYAALEAGNLEAALEAVTSGLAKAPGDPNLMLFQGVLLDLIGEKTKAAENFAQVQAGLDNRFEFFLRRSQLYLQVNRPEQAETDAQAAVALDDSSAAAWLLLGQALESQNRGFEAVSAYEKAGQLAFESGDSQVVVMARLALARLGSGAIPQ
ncbi:MAG: tetratricopeptide repeat protein [Chloroflexota bacterium]